MLGPPAICPEFNTSATIFATPDGIFTLYRGIFFLFMEDNSGLRSPPKRRMTASGPQNAAGSGLRCRPGPLTGLVCKQALKDFVLLSARPWAGTPAAMVSVTTRAE